MRVAAEKKIFEFLLICHLCGFSFELNWMKFG